MSSHHPSRKFIPSLTTYTQHYFVFVSLYPIEPTNSQQIWWGDTHSNVSSPNTTLPAQTPLPHTTCHEFIFWKKVFLTKKTLLSPFFYLFFLLLPFHRLFTKIEYIKYNEITIISITSGKTNWQIVSPYAFIESYLFLSTPTIFRQFSFIFPPIST